MTDDFRLVPVDQVSAERLAASGLRAEVVDTRGLVYGEEPPANPEFDAWTPVRMARLPLRRARREAARGLPRRLRLPPRARRVRRLRSRPRSRRAGRSPPSHPGPASSRCRGIRPCPPGRSAPSRSPPPTVVAASLARCSRASCAPPPNSTCRWRCSPCPSRPSTSATASRRPRWHPTTASRTGAGAGSGPSHPEASSSSRSRSSGSRRRRSSPTGGC